MKSIEAESFSEPLGTLDLEQQIRDRAYQLYEKRGKVHGFDVDDWLDAEAEVLDERDMVSANRPRQGSSGRQSRKIGISVVERSRFRHYQQSSIRHGGVPAFGFGGDTRRRAYPRPAPTRPERSARIPIHKRLPDCEVAS